MAWIARDADSEKRSTPPRISMPATSITHEFQQQTLTLKIEGEALSSSATTDTPLSPASIQWGLQCQIEIQTATKTHTMSGDSELLKDLIQVIHRYLASYLRGESQGTFSGHVAIRPLDFIYHRLTVRQGEGIAQVDLSMTQLYDLAEAMDQIEAEIPQLNHMKPPAPPRPWMAQPTGIAALLVGGIGIVTAATLLINGGLTPSEEVARSGENRTTPETLSEPMTPQAPPLDPEADRDETEAGTQPADDTAPTTVPIQPPTEDPLQSASTDPDETGGVSDPSEEPASGDPLQSTDSILAQDSAELSTARSLPESTAAESPTGETQPSELSPAGNQLQQQLTSTWQAPPDLTTDLIYSVTVDANGSPLVALPGDESAAELQSTTPLAGIPDTLPETLPAGTETFNIILRVDNSVNVEAQ